MADATDSLVIDNTGRLLEFLAAVAREVQTRPVRDFRKHEFVLVPGDVPSHPRVKLGPREGNPAWLSVPRLEALPVPDLPVDLEGYVDVASLNNPDGIPELRAEFAGEGHPDIQEALDDWVEAVWLDWAVRAAPVRRARDLYQRVLELRLLIQRQQATHEVVWGHSVLGLPRAGGALAPLLITRVQVELDEETGTLSVIPEGVPELELDPIEGIGLQGMEDLASLRAELAAGAPIDPWNPQGLDMINRRIVAPLGLDARTLEDEDLPVGTAAPSVSRAWMVVARPRPARHQRFYDELAEVLQEKQFLPEALASVVALEGDLDRALSVLGQEDPSDWAPVAERLLMPLPVNEEQERIARQLAAARGVTVQGPPGTGKSHTIVNLVSHLMAHGKRVLVTAQNEQALRVLRDKFPPELRDLTVSVLGSSPQHMDSLRASVQAVLDIGSRVEPAKQAKAIDELGARLDKARQELGVLDRQLVEALADEEAEFRTPEGSKRAPDVARWLRVHASELGRIPDALDSDAPCPLTSSEFSEFVSLTRAVSVEDRAEQRRLRPRAHALPTASELRRKTERLNELLDLLADLEESGLNLEALSQLTVDELRSVEDLLVRGAQDLAALKSGWTWEVCKEFRQSAHGAEYWSTLNERANATFGECQRLRTLQLGREVSLPESDHRVQKEHLSELSARFAAGKGVPKMFKGELRNFWAQCRVDGLEVRSVDEIEFLEWERQRRVEEASLRQVLQESNMQAGSPVPDLGPQFLAAAGTVLARLQAALDWEESRRNPLKDVLGRLFSRAIDSDSPEALSSAAEVIAKGAAYRESQQIQASLTELDSQLVMSADHADASTAWSELRSALDTRRWDNWDAVLQESERVEALGEGVTRWIELRDALAELAPLWVQQILGSAADEELVGDPSQVREMWAWRQAETWLKELHTGEGVEGLNRRAQELQVETERLVIDIARRSAEVAVHGYLTDEKKKALTAWQQALQKVGKGTGKNAAYFMQVARSQLPLAMGAIPAWIMPIHRVIDNFDPRISELFDVVIVDESSQCDLLSVGVLALGRKSVVVGDDKQTSPAAVGVDTARIQQLQNSYLAGIDQRQLLTADESLYGLAERVFPSVILLREHFRCLPEIIRFSNRYYDDRILPLREPLGFDIGDPLVGVRVPEGIRTGTSSAAINEIEAVTLVDQIVECHGDERYENLTFGVVTLLGNQQGPLIEKMLIDRLGFEAFERRHLRVGNAADFQGDERDVVFISVVADDNSYAAVRKPDKQRINVAASRARDQLWVFYSMDPSTLNHQDQRRALIEYVEDGGKVVIPQRNQLDACESDFEKHVLRDIVARGHEVIPQYPVGNYRIDLVVETSGGRIAVECDGDRFHGPEAFENDLRRQRVLERLGWEFWRVRASEYYREPGAAMAGLWQRISEREESAKLTAFADVAELQPPPDRLAGGRESVSVPDPESSEAGEARGIGPDAETVRELKSPDALPSHWPSQDDLLADLDWRPGDAQELTFDDDLEDFDAHLFEDSDLIDDSEDEEEKSDLDSQETTWVEHFGWEPSYSLGDDNHGLWIWDERETVFGLTMAGRRDTRAMELDGVRTPCTLAYEGTRVDFHVIEWVDGSGEIACDEIAGGGLNLKRLLHGGRLGFYPLGEDRFFAELRIMRQGVKDFPTLHVPEDGEFESVIGWSVEEFLLTELGAEMVGTRETVLGDISARRATPVVAWRGSSVDLPSFIYVASRILPLMAMDGDID